MNRLEGVVKKIPVDGETGQRKGFGFITADGSDYFFHATAVKSPRFLDLNEGDRVEFSVGEGQKGPRAEDVRLLS